MYVKFTVVVIVKLQNCLYSHNEEIKPQTKQRYKQKYCTLYSYCIMWECICGNYFLHICFCKWHCHVLGSYDIYHGVYCT